MKRVTIILTEDHKLAFPVYGFGSHLLKGTTFEVIDVAYKYGGNFFDNGDVVIYLNGCSTIVKNSFYSICDT